MRYTHSICRLALMGSLALLSTTACYQVVEGNGSLEEATREVGVFSRLVVSAPVDVEFTIQAPTENDTDPGEATPTEDIGGRHPKERIDSTSTERSGAPAESGESTGEGDTVTLELTGERNMLPYILTRVDGDALLIESDDAVVFKPTLPIKVHAAVPSLSVLELSGTSSFLGWGLDESLFRVKVSGQVYLQVVGTVETLEADTSGSSHVRLASLEAEDVTVSALGATDVEVCAQHSVTIEAAGSSRVRYACEPEEVTIGAEEEADVGTL